MDFRRKETANVNRLQSVYVQFLFHFSQPSAYGLRAECIQTSLPRWEHVCLSETHMAILRISQTMQERVGLLRNRKKKKQKT